MNCDILPSDADFSKYKTVILPYMIVMSEEFKTRLKESEHKLQPYYQKKKNCEGHIENLIWKIRKYSRQEGNETKSPLTSEEEQQAF